MKIILNNGNEINNLTLNGNNYISKNVLSDDIFTDGLSIVTVVDGDISTEYKNMKLVQNIVLDGKSWFILAEKTQEEILKERLKSTEDVLMILMDLQMMGGI